MNIAQKTVLITGANRGIGQALVNEAVRRGAKRVSRVDPSNTEGRHNVKLAASTLNWKKNHINRGAGTPSPTLARTADDIAVA